MALVLVAMPRICRKPPDAWPTAVPGLPGVGHAIDLRGLLGRDDTSRVTPMACRPNRRAHSTPRTRSGAAASLKLALQDISQLTNMTAVRRVKP